MSGTEYLHILPWETGPKGKTGYTSPTRLVLKKPGLNLKLIAISKAFDVSVISSDFRGQPCVFEPWILLLVDKKIEFVFAGAYRRAFGAKSGEPQMCVRFCRWQEADDYEGYDQADDKRAYILSDAQVRTQMRFLDTAGQSDLVSLVKEADEVMKKLDLRPRDRPENSIVQVRCMVSNRVQFDVKYSPQAFISLPFEEWLHRWSEVIEHRTEVEGMVPDEDIQVSYQMSFWERLLYHEFI